MLHCARVKLLLITVLALAPACTAQECTPEAHPQAESAFAYVKAEIQALQTLRQAQEEEKKIPAPGAPGDPQRAQKAATRNNIARSLSKYYDCSSRWITPYKNSTNDRVRESVQAFLSGLEQKTSVNNQVLEALQIVDKAESADAVDKTAMKKLSDLMKVEDNARALIMGGVKMSTYSLVKEKINEEDTTPYAFRITAKERDALLADTQKLARKSNASDPQSFIDGCAEILLSTLRQNLPTATK